MKKILITGFDPFGGEQVNPAFLAVSNLPIYIDDYELIKAEIPTIFNESAIILKKLIEDHKPSIVICVGQAGGRTSIAIEKVAINFDDARICDNDLNQPIDQAIIVDGPTAYFSNLPIKGMALAIQMAGLPAVVSYSAGTFVCNHIFYQLMHMIQTSYPHILGGFIHVPYCESQVVDKPHMPSMSLQNITRALEIAITSILQPSVQTDHANISTGTEF